jgi:hypothetical protein
MSYNASGIKIYNLVHFENKNIYFSTLKNSSKWSTTTVTRSGLGDFFTETFGHPAKIGSWIQSYSPSAVVAIIVKI